MDAPAARIALLCGSPHKGNSVRLASLVAQGIAEAGGLVDSFFLHEHSICGCRGCGACNTTGECVITRGGQDDFARLEAILASADHLIVVSPVYFAGPPSQLKAVYDRFQPLWARRYLLNQPVPAKRPASLFAVGTGNDPFGFEPLVTITRSALNIAGFALGEVFDFIGYCGEACEEMDRRAFETGRMIALDAKKDYS